MKNTFAKKFTVCALAGVLGFALSACDDSSSAGGDNGSGGNRGGIPDTVETFMELSDYDCGKSQKCVATYLTEYHNMAVCDGDNGWVIGTLIEKMDCDFSSSSDKSSDSKSNDPAEVTDDSSDSKSNDPAEATDDSSDSKDCPSSAGTSTESSNSNSSGNDAMSSNSSAKSSSSSVIVTNSSSSRNENSSSSETTLSCSSELSEASSSSESLSAGSIYDATANTLTDLRDGKTYKTVTIGRQIWMAENLNYAYTDVFYKRDNYTSDSTSWCYDNDPANCAKYGRLYTWAAAMDSLGKWSKNGKKCGYIASCSPTYPVRGICPKGWHLPSKQEFGTLITAVGDSSTNGTVLKSTDGWSNHGNGTDAFGFSALPAGARSDGHYVRRGSYAYFWSSNDTKGISHDAYRMYLYCGEDIAGLIYDNKNHGASVRCVKDSN
ncbi:fibrobacter succinogenes major paralogous domain-containing protein [Fibrobacter sp.]|uniref:fibrobacter succinogenes major paralogous domain-containing protein n=1 Tax=Fibrobacter sp. TaxID=35828 RepID=UPI003864A8CB